MSSCTVVAIVGDQHANSKMGLCPRSVKLDNGGTYKPSPSQKAILKAWMQYWEIVHRQVAEHKAKLVVVFTGDCADKNRHDGLDPICRNDANILAMLGELYGPIARAANELYIVKGTEAHTGPHAQLEDQLATALKAVPDDWEGTPAWWWLPLECGGVRFDIAHHPSTSGRKEWTKGAAPSRMSTELALQYLERGEKAPDVAVRGHIHYYADSGTARRPRVFYLDGWKVTDAFGHRLGTGGMSRAIGGMWFLCRDGQYEAHRESWQPKRRRTWQRTI